MRRRAFFGAVATGAAAAAIGSGCQRGEDAAEPPPYLVELRAVVLPADVAPAITFHPLRNRPPEEPAGARDR